MPRWVMAQVSPINHVCPSREELRSLDCIWQGPPLVVSSVWYTYRSIDPKNNLLTWKCENSIGCVVYTVKKPVKTFPKSKYESNLPSWKYSYKLAFLKYEISFTIYILIEFT